MATSQHTQAVSREPQSKSRIRRTCDHVLAGLTLSAPVNMASGFVLSSMIESAAVLAVSTTLFATLFSGCRTYFVLSIHERQPT